MLSILPQSPFRWLMQRDLCVYLIYAGYSTRLDILLHAQLDSYMHAHDLYHGVFLQSIVFVVSPYNLWFEQHYTQTLWSSPRKPPSLRMCLHRFGYSLPASGCSWSSIITWNDLKIQFFLCVKPAHADIAENGYVNVLDARIILQAAAGRIEL